MARKGVVLVGLVLLAAATGAVIARRGNTGAVLRTVAVSGGVGAVAVAERTGRAFVSTSTNVDVFDARSGALLHAVAVDPGVLAVAERAGRVFVVASNMSSGSPGTVSVLDARSGRVIRTGAAGPVPYAVAVDERAGRAFVLNANIGGVGVYDAASGRFLGTFNDGPNGGPYIAPFTLAVDARRARLFVITGDIFGHSPGTRLSVLDTRGGRLVRIPRVGMYPSGMVVDEQLGRTFVSSAGGINILDDRTGRVLRTIGGLAGELALDEQRGRLFVATGTGIGSRVRIVDARSGALLHAVFAGQNPVAMAVDEQNGRAFIASEGLMVGPVNDTYMATGMGSVTEIDGRSGAMLRTIPVGVNPVALAVDERTQRVFVITGGGTIAVHGPDAWSWVPAWPRRRLPFLPQPTRSTRSVPAGVTVLDATR